MTDLPHAPSTWSCLPARPCPWLSALDAKFSDLLSALQHREAKEPRQWAELTLSALELCFSREFPSSFTVADLVRLVRRFGSVLTEARPAELSVGNIVRRALNALRREAKQAAEKLAREAPLKPQPMSAASTAAARGADHHSFLGVFGAADAGSGWGALPASAVAPAAAALLGDLRLDFDDATVVKDARQHIYANEVVLTHGYSSTLVRFLRRAAEDRPFEVYVAESSPSLAGHRMAAELAQLGIRATVIPDAAVFAVMPSVSKAIVDTHAVLADGGVLARAGAANVTLAARHYTIPVVALAGVYKLSPLFAFDQDTFNEHLPPAQAATFGAACEGYVDIVNPAYDHIPPQHVSLLISNLDEDMTGYQPSYVYRIVAQLYDPQDYSFDDDDTAAAAAATAVKPAVETAAAPRRLAAAPTNAV